MIPQNSKYFYTIIITAAIIAIGIIIIFIPKLISAKQDSSLEMLDDTTNYISINQTLTNDSFKSLDLSKMDNYINKFLTKWELKGANLAIIKDGKLFYAKGYGWADEEDSLKMRPGNIMRLASLSKLITATAIMKLQEDSLLNLSDKVFGENGILNEDKFQKFVDKRVKNISIENLLRHQAGFSLRRGDPMFTTREIVIWEELDTIPTSDQVIQYALKHRLGFTPGTSTIYSNLGYLILSKVIEKKSGMSYEEYCQKNILFPAGCYDMHIAKNFYEEKYPNEVRYYEVHDAQPIYAFDNSGEKAPHRYGGNNITGLQGAGAWVASPAEYAHLISHIDNDIIIEDILKESSINAMLSRSAGRLPIGWSKGSLNGDWTRTGSLAGTSAVTKKFKDGSIWVFITNTSAWKGSRFTRNIEYLIKRCRGLIKE